jgi:hypothetical protein
MSNWGIKKYLYKIRLFLRLPTLDAFRTLNWVNIKKELELQTSLKIFLYQ